MIRAVGLALSLLATASVGAEVGYFRDGNALYRECTSTDTEDSASCVAYVVGVVDSFTFTSRQVCLPKGVQGGQVRDLVVNFLRERPEMRQYSAPSLITPLVKRVWPCGE